MKAFSVAAEKKAIRSLLSKGKGSEFLFANLKEDYFHTDVCLSAYKRVSSIMMNRGKPPSWDDIIEDPTLDEDHRTELRAYKKKPIVNEDALTNLISTLNNYRKLRILYNIQASIASSIQKTKVEDIDAILDATTDKLLSARSSNNYENQLVHIGSGGSLKSALEVVDKTLDPEAQVYLPTGFSTFDSVNVGLPRGGLFILGGTTGGFKTAATLQIAHNLADNGLRVAVVQLEMDKCGVMTRNLSNWSSVDMGKIINPKHLTSKEARSIRNTFIRRFKKVKKRGGLETYFHPEEDLSIEQVLYLLKPYKYDAIFIDYLGLLKGHDGEDQWRALGKSARFAKVFANNNNVLIGLAAQLSEEGLLRYSRTLGEHASNLWTWVMDAKAREDGLLNINQGKARNQNPFSFKLKVIPENMKVRDLTSKEMASIKSGKSKSKEEEDEYYN